MVYICANHGKHYISVRFFFNLARNAIFIQRKYNHGKKSIINLTDKTCTLILSTKIQMHYLHFQIQMEKPTNIKNKKNSHFLGHIKFQGGQLINRLKTSNYPNISTPT